MIREKCNPRYRSFDAGQGKSRCLVQSAVNPVNPRHLGESHGALVHARHSDALFSQLWKRISDTGHRVVSLLTKELKYLPQKTVSVFQGLEERLIPRLGSLFSEQYPERSRGKVLATSTS